MTALWIPNRKRRFEMAIRHLPIEERGRMWVLYHEGGPDWTWEDTAARVCEDLNAERAERLTGVQ